MASLLKTFGTLVLTFIMTPIILSYIGPEDFGTFKVLTEVHSYLSLVEMGLLASFIGCLVPLLKKGNQSEIDELMAQGSWRFWKISLWTLLCGAAIFPFLERLTSWSGPTSGLHLTFLMLLGTAFIIPSNIYRGYLEASNKGHLVHFVNFIQSICFALIAVLFAYWGWGIKAQGMALLGAVTIGALLLRGFSDRKVDLQKRNNRLDKEISTKQRSQVLNELAGKLCFHVDQVILAIVLGPLMVTKVFLGQRVVQVMQQQLLSLGQASWASLGALYYQQETNQGIFEKRMLEMTKLLAIFAIAGLVPICVLNKAFVELWVGDSYLMDGNALVLLASANAFFLGLFSFWGHILAVLSKQSSITKLFWIQAIINVIASLISVHLFGGIGPLIGTLVSNLLVPLWMYPRVLKVQLGLHERKLFLSFFWPLMVGITLLTLYYYSPLKFTGLSWIEFILAAISIFLLNATLLFFLLFTKEEKTLYLNRLMTLKKSLF